MSYTPQTWVDNQSPLTAARMGVIESGIQNADFYTVTSTTRPTAGLFDGMRIYETDTKAYGFYDATNTVWHMWDTVNQTFTPTWGSYGGTACALGNGVCTGVYKRMGRHVWVRINWQAGSSTTGGNGTGLYFTVPTAIQPYAAGAQSEQWVPCKIYLATGAANYAGIASVGSTTQNWLMPMFPVSATNNNLGNWRSADGTNAAGTGYPQVSGNYSVSSNSNLTIEGTYEMAAG